MKQSLRPRGTAKLPASVHHQLNLYALSAVSAGVGLLAFAHPAEAKIVYTPAHVRIGDVGTHALDLNHDGNVDFTFVAKFSFLSTFSFGGTLSVQPAVRFNEVSVYSNYSARALQAGDKIGGNGHFRHISPFLAQTHVASCFGKWCNVKNRYLGLKFVIDGRTHFGWARLNVKVGSNGMSSLLTGYAYETIPNKPIIAGKTKGPDAVTLSPVTTLGHLARGR